VNSYGTRMGGIVGVIGGRERPRLSADSTAIKNVRKACAGSGRSVKSAALATQAVSGPRREMDQVAH